MTLTLQPASAADLDAIRAVLSESDLPTEDIDRHLANFVLAKRSGQTIGTVALEYVGDAALLRSLCVARTHRGHAVGAQLLEAIEVTAASLGARELFLLTTNSAAFFARHGFSQIPRAAAPPGIQGTEQFRTICPSTAIIMHKSLPARSRPGSASR